MTEVKASTQEHLDILDIDQDLLILKNGSTRMVLITTAVNFDLLSEREQDRIITAYSGLLNSLSFPIQILVRSKKMDISVYLDRLKQSEREQINPQLKKRIESYHHYVESLVSKNDVLDKRFYIVIPHDEMVIKKAPGLLDQFTGKNKVTFDKRGVMERARVGLEPRRDHIVKQLSRIGLKARQLNTSELVALFYDIYNPDLSRSQHMRFGAEEYTAPIVRPAITKG